MTYKKSISELFELRRFGIRPGLENIKKLLYHLGNPHKNLKFIHIAGTNGKGSTAAFLHSVLKHSNYKTGLYTSPHLIDFCERIKINDTQIKKKRVTELIEKIKKICFVHKIKNTTFFDFATALAFIYFYEEKVDLAVIETGLGGKYDSTNVINPLVSVITNIGLEHQKYLGKTIAEITSEKAGIIKIKRPVVTGVKQQKTKNILKETSNKSDSPLYISGRDFEVINISSNLFNYKSNTSKILKIKSGLLGDHQIENAALAIKTSEILIESGYKISEQNIKNGIRKAFWPGRMEVISENPKIILDGAHNPEAWKQLKKSINNQFDYNRLFLIIGVLEDKNINSLIKTMLPGTYKTMFFKPDIYRAADKEILKKYIVFSDTNRIFWYDDPIKTLTSAMFEAGQKDLILVTGSLFTVGEIRQHLVKKNKNISGRIPL
jgi:dihydrofolate synthase/folylpolyglutamate synthase